MSGACGAPARASATRAFFPGLGSPCRRRRPHAVVMAVSPVPATRAPSCSSGHQCVEYDGTVYIVGGNRVTNANGGVLWCLSQFLQNGVWHLVRHAMAPPHSLCFLCMCVSTYLRGDECFCWERLVALQGLIVRVSQGVALAVWSSSPPPPTLLVLAVPSGIPRGRSLVPLRLPVGGHARPPLDVRGHPRGVAPCLPPLPPSPPPSSLPSLPSPPDLHLD